MSVLLEMDNAVSFASIHQAALLVDVRKAFSWTLIEEVVLVSCNAVVMLLSLAPSIEGKCPKSSLPSYPAWFEACWEVNTYGDLYA